MFGGWKADLEMGYNIPASEVLSRGVHDPSLHVLNISFGCPFPSVAIDDLTVRVILPEGATNIQWSTPFDVDEEAWESRVTYLDVTGRPVLVLRKHNVVAAHNQKFQVC